MKDQDSNLSYETSLFFLDKKNKKLLPKIGGIYVLWEDGRIYCGSTDNLFRRVPKSIREQGFGRTIYYYPESFLTYNGNMTSAELLKSIEIQCISAVFTITYGNGIPFDLTNEQHAHPLLASAWRRHKMGKNSLGVDIAQTVLHDVMVPDALNLLPFYAILSSDAPPKIRAENALRWNGIVNSERDRRRRKGFWKGALWCIKTD